MFVSINYIPGTEKSREKLERFFARRSKALERIPGFSKMQVLKPVDEKSDYLIISEWESQEDFQKWSASTDFTDDHNKAMEDIHSMYTGIKEYNTGKAFRTYQEIKSWRKVKSWFARIGVIGLVFIIVKGLIWLAVLLGAGNVLK